LWNSGMFLMRADVWLAELKQHAPAMLAQCHKALSGGRQDGEFYRVENEAFKLSPSDSLDYAVMEQTERAAVVPLDAGWSDVGAWSTLWQESERDADGNVVQGDVCLHNTENALVLAQHRLVAAVGVKNLIVVETADAVLVMDRNCAQDVK